MIKNYFIFILTLFIFMHHARATDWADGASMTGEEYSFPNLVYSPSLPPYKDVIGGGDTSTPAAVASPPPPYCLYPPPPTKPAMPALLPPVASSPGASPTPATGPPSFAPGITPPSGASPPAGLPSIAPGIISPPGASPLAGSPFVVPSSTAPPPPPLMPPGGASPLAPAGPPSIAPGIISPPGGAFPAAGSPSVAPGSSAPPPAPAPPFMPPGGHEERRGTWCVANPKAASAVVQTAMDYACGSGADCGAAAAGGPCYLPDTLTAHASYAFNSYWQRTKAAGGTCDFAGAAMLVTTDPSHDGCKFVCM
ncbi:unnamed protein product [Urochloa decumbens]|uniref:X8 domain-containing protein n=1 Tax=Urochloa decumbens TaxID=240449 RepID=A0ABC9DI48_9POAL